MSTTVSQNYNVDVSASFTVEPNTSLTPNVSIHLKVTSTYVPDATLSPDKSNPTPGSFLNRANQIETSRAEKSLLIPGRSLLFYNDGSFFGKMISDMNIPFSLDNLEWRTSPGFGSISLANEDDLIMQIISYVRSAAIEYATSDQRNKLRFLLNIEKKIVIPHQEFQVMAYERERELAIRRFEANINRMLQQLGFRNRRAIRESLEQAESKQIPASQASIEALEEVMHDGDGPTTKCTICLEDLAIGSRVTRMPCNHKFHKTCILTWLGTAHVCPLCRSKLPTM
ncbi:E3 ubiquitin-protein ligase MBR1-like [Mercurialis annua]|uniref:E3 ubiquitin-protein ligase MBR1-like n=1 Tax=Mercurialis annua TaxID=3986 RepID=UPI002160534C|nr:E3 ubiquitin-protein ligase MBR1-like [Mercurialis annua]